MSRLPGLGCGPERIKEKKRKMKPGHTERDWGD